MLAKDKKINKSAEKSSSTFGVVKDRKTQECTKYKPLTESTDRLPVTD